MKKEIYVDYFKCYILTFGYHSISMGITRGYEQERIGLFCHSGAIHDTIYSVEIFKGK